jgi:DNA-binding MarR family transcriptional regulator/GNAT superfamily N-acetyltransferase
MITVDSVNGMEVPRVTTLSARRTTGPTPAQVAQVRAFNRFYTNVIGVLHGMYLDLPYTVTEGRVLFEIARGGTADVTWLRQSLNIDAGYLSRVLRRFEADGLVTRHRSATDARRQEIRLTDAGRSAAAELDARAVGQIGALLGDVDCAPLLDAMRVITESLGGTAQGALVPGLASTERVVTLRPLAIGDLGWILQRHGTLYAAEFGWDATFEVFCAQIIAEYPALRDRNPGRAEGWIAEVDGVPAGSVCCVPDGASPDGNGPDGNADAGSTARLRLLLVEPWARGLGLGARLVARCLDFAREADFADIVLLTYDQLTAARRVYQAAGFHLDAEHREEAFGQVMNGQSWSRAL